MTKVSIIGYGNIGKYAVDAVRTAPDMTLAGVVRREGSLSKSPEELSGVKVVSDIKELLPVDVAILSVPSRAVPHEAKKYLEMGINTVDSYDIHTEIFELRKELSSVALKHNAVSIISGGWDPGSDSILRTLLEVLAPKGLTHTNFGEGMSMGHTVAVKSMEGVKDALSLTIPMGTSIHRRLVYVVLHEGADLSSVKDKVMADPYFSHDETHIIQVEDVNSLIDVGHGLNMTRKGVSGKTHNQLFEFNMKINNPALTSQVMVACARASMKQAPGAYTLIEIPVIDLHYGDEENIIRRLV